MTLNDLYNQGAKGQIEITGADTSINDPSFEGNQGIKKALSGADDYYTISLTDPTGNLENSVWDRYIEVGQRDNITEQLLWTIKKISSQGNTSKGATIIYSANGTELKRVTTNDGNIPTTQMSERFDQNTGLPTSIRITAANADDINLNVVAYKDTMIIMPGLTQSTVELIGNFEVTTEIRNDDGNASVGIVDQYGNPLSSGNADATQQFQSRLDSLHNAKIIISADYAQTQKIVKTLFPGTTNTSTVIDWIYQNTITGKNGVQILGEFNGKTVFDYITSTEAEVKTFQDTLIAGNITVKQTLEN